LSDSYFSTQGIYRNLLSIFTIKASTAFEVSNKSAISEMTSFSASLEFSSIPNATFLNLGSNRVAHEKLGVRVCFSKPSKRFVTWL